jgi:hypothetical protein
MEVRLAGLRFFIGGHLHIYIPPGVRSLWHSFPCFVGLDFYGGKNYLKREKNPGHCLRIDLGLIWMHSFDGNPANRRLLRETIRNKKLGVERQTTEGQASPSDCHKTDKRMSDEDIF